MQINHQTTVEPELLQLVVEEQTSEAQTAVRFRYAQRQNVADGRLVTKRPGQDSLVFFLDLDGKV